MKQKSKILFLILFLVLILTGCDEEYKMVLCTSSGSIGEDAKLEFKVNIYYDNDNYVKKTVSKEIVTSTNQDILKTYESMAKNSYKEYKKIEGYDNNITIKDGKLISETTINYNESNIAKIKKIEENKNKLYTNSNKIKLNKLLKYYQKSGSKCYAPK